MSGKGSQHYGGTVQGLGHWEMALLNTEPKSTMQSYKNGERRIKKLGTSLIKLTTTKPVTTYKYVFAFFK